MSTVEALYDQVAAFYVQTSPDRYDGPVEVALLALIGPVGGLDVLDLCCGHGRMTREIARRGAHVIGLDVSTELLAVARSMEERDALGISYVAGDAASAECLSGASFDVVGCHFGLSDIDDLVGSVATVQRVLRPGGRFVFSILHPCFPGWGPDVVASWPPGNGYFDEGRWFAHAAKSTLRQRVGSCHRTLSTYINTMSDHGLSVTEMAEPSPPPQWHDEQPAADLVPTFLVVRCQRN